MPELHEVLDGRRIGGPSVEVGDTVRVHVKVVEGGKERVQAFEGVVIGLHRPERLDGTFRVRRVTHACIPRAARRDSEGGLWVNGLPEIERRKGQEHAVNVAIRAARPV